jgi:hypothetical protein
MVNTTRAGIVEGVCFVAGINSRAPAEEDTLVKEKHGCNTMNNVGQDPCDPAIFIIWRDHTDPALQFGHGEKTVPLKTTKRTQIRCKSKEASRR